MWNDWLLSYDFYLGGGGWLIWLVLELLGDVTVTDLCVVTKLLNGEKSLVRFVVMPFDLFYETQALTVAFPRNDLYIVGVDTQALKIRFHT